MVRRTADSGSSSPSASKKSGPGEGVSRSGGGREKKDIPYKEMRVDESRGSECREPDIAVILATLAET